MMDDMVIKGMNGVEDQGLPARVVVAPMEVGKVVLFVDIVPVRLAVLTDMYTDKKLELSKHLIPTFSGKIGKDRKKNKSGANIQLLEDGGCNRS